MFTLFRSSRRPLTNHRIDPETLASFLDGTLPAAERERVLEALAQGGEAYDAFVEARALLDARLAGEGASVAPQLRPPSPTRSLIAAVRKPNAPWRSRTGVAVGGLLAAAGIAAILVLGRGPTAGTPALLAVHSVSDGLSAVTDLEARLGASWNQPRWTALRGTTESFSDRAYAFRLGVRYAQFSVALSATDTRFKQPVSGALAELAARDETGAPVALRVEQLARSSDPRAAADERSRVASELRALTSNPNWFDLGAWSESARLAATSGDRTFFGDERPTMRALSGIVAGLERQRDDERATVDSIVEPLRRLSRRGGGSLADLSTVATVLDSVVARGGR